MQIEIYGDVFFLINFVMDLIIFWASAKFLRRRIKFYRILLGTLSITSLYCLALFNSCYDIRLAFLVLTVGVIIIFQPDSFWMLIKIIFLVHVIAFIIGGMTMALCYYIDFSHVINNIVSCEPRGFSFRILLISTCVFFILIKLSADHLKRWALSKQIFYEINIYLGEKKSSFNALVDTGNTLYDCITGQPIIIAQLDKIKDIFPKEILFDLETKNLEGLVLCDKIKFNFVPFKSIGNENGLLICFRPDQIKILCGSDSQSNKNIFVSNALIGICNFKLSKYYYGLINPSLLS